VSESKEQVRGLRTEVERLTPPPVQFPLEKFATTKELEDFAEGVRNRVGDIALHAKRWDKGFPGLRDILQVTEMHAIARKSGSPAGRAEHFRPRRTGPCGSSRWVHARICIARHANSLAT
jgi:hypothetical protein